MGWARLSSVVTLALIQTCTSASKHVIFCRYWRLTYTFWSGAAHDQDCARTPSTTKFAALNYFELSTQFIGQKITLGILANLPMIL